MANESPTIGLHLTPETEGSKPFKDWRTEMSGDDATSNLMIIDEAFSEVMENQTDISDAIDNINTELSSKAGIAESEAYTDAQIADNMLAVGQYVATREEAILVDVAQGDSTTLSAAKTYADTKDAALIPLTQRGTANGVATLDASAEIPSGQIPEYFVVCTTPAATATKVITIGNLDIATLKPGTTIAFYLSSGNTNAAPALDVNGQGAKMMYSTLTGTNITASEFGAATTYIAVWDGTNWGVTNPQVNVPPGVFYGTCATAVATATKTVSITGFVRRVGTIVGIYFNATNTASNPKLNVGGTGAADIYIGRSNIDPDRLLSGAVFLFQWDGTYWQMLNPVTIQPAVAGRVILTESQTFNPADYGITPAMPVTVTIVDRGQSGDAGEAGFRTVSSNQVTVSWGQGKGGKGGNSGAARRWRGLLSGEVNVVVGAGNVGASSFGSHGGITIGGNSSGGARSGGGSVQDTTGSLAPISSRGPGGSGGGGGYTVDNPPWGNGTVGEAMGMMVGSWGGATYNYPILIPTNNGGSGGVSAGDGAGNDGEDGTGYGAGGGGGGGGSVYAAVSTDPDAIKPGRPGRPGLPGAVIIEWGGEIMPTPEPPVTSYGTSSTSASTAIKVVNVTSYSENIGDLLNITFTAANSNANPTLRINDGTTTVDRPTSCQGGNVTSGKLKANIPAVFKWTGTAWDLLNPF